MYITHSINDASVSHVHHTKHCRRYVQCTWERRHHTGINDALCDVQLERRNHTSVDDALCDLHWKGDTTQATMTLCAMYMGKETPHKRGQCDV